MFEWSHNIEEYDLNHVTFLTKRHLHHAMKIISTEEEDIVENGKDQPADNNDLLESG